LLYCYIVILLYCYLCKYLIIVRMFYNSKVLIKKNFFFELYLLIIVQIKFLFKCGEKSSAYIF